MRDARLFFRRKIPAASSCHDYNTIARKNPSLPGIVSQVLLFFHFFRIPIPHGTPPPLRFVFSFFRPAFAVPPPSVFSYKDDGERCFISWFWIFLKSFTTAERRPALCASRAVRRFRAQTLPNVRFFDKNFPNVLTFTFGCGLMFPALKFSDSKLTASIHGLVKLN